MVGTWSTQLRIHPSPKLQFDVSYTPVKLRDVILHRQTYKHLPKYSRLPLQFLLQYLQDHTDSDENNNSLML